VLQSSLEVNLRLEAQAPLNMTDNKQPPWIPSLLTTNLISFMDSIYNDSYRDFSSRYLVLRDSSELSTAINLELNSRESRCAAALDTWTPDGSKPQNDPACQDEAASTEDENVRGCNPLNMSVLDKSLAHGSILKVAKPLEPRATRPRVGHNKSRRGCHNCKRRKVKVILRPICTFGRKN
jgi:hypothetical protein